MADPTSVPDHEDAGDSRGAAVAPGGVDSAGAEGGERGGRIGRHGRLAGPPHTTMFHLWLRQDPDTFQHRLLDHAERTGLAT